MSDKHKEKEWRRGDNDSNKLNRRRQEDKANIACLGPQRLAAASTIAQAEAAWLRPRELVDVSAMEQAASGELFRRRKFAAFLPSAREAETPVRERMSKAALLEADVEEDAESEDVCHMCLLSSYDGSMVLCDGKDESGLQCNAPYHCFCIGLTEVPAGEWLCPDCVVCQGSSIGSSASPDCVVDKVMCPKRCRNTDALSQLELVADCSPKRKEAKTRSGCKK